MRITTGITLALLMSTAGCGGDYEDGGVLSPTGPSGVSSPATPKGGMSTSPMGTTNAQAHGGLATAQANNMQSAKPDTRTVDFSSVKWEWNAAKTHLEPDSFPDARVRSGSNVWRRDNGTGLIRIFSDTDLSGMRFSTAGSSWPLSMRRAGLYVSNISGADVERIRAGGGTGGRIDEPTNDEPTNDEPIIDEPTNDEPTIDEPTIDEPTNDEPTAITCWASEAGKEVTVDAVGASIETPVEVTCDRSIDLPDDEAVVKTAAAPLMSPDWIDLTSNRYALRVPAGRSVYVDVILYPDDNGTSARVGNVVWPTVPPGEMSSLSALVVHQPGRTVGSDNPPIILICLEPSSFSPKRPGPCPDRVGVGTTVSLRAIVTPPPSGYVTEEVNGRLNGKIECGVGKEARTCGWRISQVDGSGTPGRFESGDSVNLTWRAPSSPGSVTIGGRYQLYVQGVGGSFPVPEHWSDNKGDAAGSNTLTFDVIEPTSPPDLRPHLSCDNGPMDSEIDKNGTSCDSIDGADVAVTLTVTRPNGTTVSSLLYHVEWDVRGGGPTRHQLLTSHPYHKQSAPSSDLVEHGTHDWWSGSRGCCCAAQWLQLCLQLHPGPHHREGEGSAAGGERDRLHSQGDTAGRQPRRLHSNARRSGRTGAPRRSQYRRIRSQRRPVDVHLEGRQRQVQRRCPHQPDNLERRRALDGPVHRDRECRGTPHRRP